MRTSFATHNHGNTVNTKLHRASIVDVEADDYDYNRNACAPEGACCRDENQGRGPDCPDHPRASKIGTFTVVLVATLAIAAALMAIHFGAPR